MYDEQQNPPPESIMQPQPPPPPAPIPAPIPAAEKAEAKPIRKGLLPEEAQTLSEIIEALGGVTAGRLKLCVQKNIRGQGWKSLRSIQIEEWMITDGLDIPEVVGEAYGDGFYRWQLRYAGKFLRKGDCNLEGYTEVRDDALPPPDGKDDEIESVDISGMFAQLRSELREEMRAVSQPQANQGDQLKAVMEPLMRFLEAKFPGQPTKPQGADPTVTALIGMIAQQTSAFMQVMAQMQATGSGNPNASLRDNVGALKEILEVVKTLAPSEPTYFYGAEDVEEAPPAVSEVSTEPSVPAQDDLLGGLKNTLNAAAGRLLTNIVSAGEDRLTGQVMSQLAGAGSRITPAQQGTKSPTPSQQVEVLSPQAVREYEALFEMLDQCVSAKVPVEDLARQIVADLPLETLQQLAADGVSAQNLAELSLLLGKPEITEKLRRPEFENYLTRLLEIFRVHLSSENSK